MTIEEQKNISKGITDAWGPFLYGEENWATMKARGEQQAWWRHGTFVLKQLCEQAIVLALTLAIIMLAMAGTARLIKVMWP